MNRLAQALLLTVTLLVSGTFAPIFNPGGGGSSITIAEQDGSPSGLFTTLKFTDGTLTDNGDGTVSIVNIGSLTSVTLDFAFDNGKIIDGATSAANAVQIGGDAASKRICIYHEAATGVHVVPCDTTANIQTEIPTNVTWSLYDAEATAAIETVDPDGASAHAIWSYPTATYRPKKSIWFPAGSLSPNSTATDGQRCEAPAEVQINSGAFRWTIICDDHDSATIYGEVLMPNGWDGGTVTMTGAFIQTAADTSNVNADIAMACRADSDAINNTWGTEVAMDTAMSGSSDIDYVTTTAITPNGTCTGDNTLLQFRFQLDATGTTTAVATLHVVGFKLEYNVDSRSD